MEGRVEDGYLRHVGQRPASLGQRSQRRGVVQWDELRQRREFPLDPGVDHDRLSKAWAAVDDPMGDGLDPRRNVLERRDGRRRVLLVDGRELEARRPGIDDQD